MSYRVDYNALDEMYEQVDKQAEAWDNELKDVKVALERIQATDNMTGNGADAIRDYLSMIHMPIINSLIDLVNLHRTNLSLYKFGYQGIDSGLDAIINKNELLGIIDNLGVMKENALDVNESALAVLEEVRDIFRAPIKSITNLTYVIDSARDLCTKLDEDVEAYETERMNNDFVASESIIDNMRQAIETYLGKSRNFKAHFDPNSPENVNASRNLSAIQSYLVKDLDGKAEAAQAAIENHEARKELEKRIETAKWEKLLVTAAVVVGSAVLIAALPVGGALVVGAVSGLSGAILDANNKAMDLYIEDGDLSAEDWKDIGAEGAKGFAVGFATGVVGGAIGKGITSGAKATIPLMSSSNVTVNTATRVVVGSTSKIVSGIATRATGEIIEQSFDDEAGINWTEVGDEAFDGKKIVKDGVVGGVNGYVSGKKVDYEKTMNSEYEKDVLKEMYENGEMDYSIDDPAYNILDEPPKSFTDKVGDFFINKDVKPGVSVDEILSSDDYTDKKYDIFMGTYEAYDKGSDILNSDSYVMQSNDEILHDVTETLDDKPTGGGRRG